MGIGKVGAVLGYLLFGRPLQRESRRNEKLRSTRIQIPQKECSREFGRLPDSTFCTAWPEAERKAVGRNRTGINFQEVEGR
jgi:hypothetical protein